VDTPKQLLNKSSLYPQDVTKQIPLQPPHETAATNSPSNNQQPPNQQQYAPPTQNPSYMQMQMPGIPYNNNYLQAKDADQNSINNFMQEQKPSVYQTVPNPNMYPNQMQSQSLPRNPPYSHLQQQELQQQMFMKKPDIATVGPNQHLQMNANNPYQQMQQQPYDYNGNPSPNQGLSNLGIPLQAPTQQQAAGLMGNTNPNTSSPYMQVPQNSAIVRDNASGYPYPSNPRMQQQQQQQQQQHLNMNPNYMMANRQMFNGNVYQKPPQMMQQQQQYQQPPMQNQQSPQQQQQMQNEYGSFNYQAPYQRMPFPQGAELPANMMPYDQSMPMPNVYMQAQQFQKAIPKKVTFEAGTKGGSDCPSPTVSVQNDQSNNNSSNLSNNNFGNGNSNNIGLMNPQTVQQAQMIQTKVFNNAPIVKQAAKAVLCSLCRKKSLFGTSLYCSDCEYYMSRFQPRR
jgi:hypothetical protein